MRGVPGVRQEGLPRAQGGAAAGVRPLHAWFPPGLPGPAADCRARGALPKLHKALSRRGPCPCQWPVLCAQAADWHVVLDEGQAAPPLDQLLHLPGEHC